MGEWESKQTRRPLQAIRVEHATLGPMHSLQQ